MIDFNKMVNRYIEREFKPKEKGRYYPSEIGNCIRKVWYSYKYPQQVDLDLLKVFEVGNIMHGLVVEILKSEKNKEVELLQSEFPFKMQLQDFTISGRVDDVIILKENGKKLLVEVKSTKNIEAVNKPQINHAVQLQLYMHATIIHNGVVLYIDKNNLQSKVFPIQYEKEKAVGIINRFKNLHRCLGQNELPDAEAKQEQEMNWMCRFCEYSEKCGLNEK